LVESASRSRQWITGRRLGVLLWGGALVLACAGLGRYRVGNDLSQWSSSDLRDAEWSAAVIVAWEPHLTAQGEADLLSDLQAIEGVVSCLPSQPLLAKAVVNHVPKQDALRGAVIRHDPEVEQSHLQQRIRDVCQHAGLAEQEVYLSGPSVIASALDDWSQRGLQRASILILIVGLAGVWLSTRKWSIAVRTCLAVYASQIMLMGVWGWSGRSVDMMLSAVPPLMMALGFSFALHRAARPGIMLPMLLCGATTAAGFLTLGVTSAPAIRGFALWGAVGIALVWASVMLLVPPDHAVWRRAKRRSLHQATAGVHHRRCH